MNNINMYRLKNASQNCPNENDRLWLKAIYTLIDCGRMITNSERERLQKLIDEFGGDQK